VSESDPAAHPIQLVDAWLSEVSFSNNPEFRQSEPVALNYGVDSETGVRADLETGNAEALLHLRIIWRDATNEPTTLGPFELSLAVAGTFLVPQMPEEKRERLEQWLEFMSPYLLWPYARAYIASITSLSPHPALTLFTRHMPQPRALEPETQEQSPLSSPPSG
jgi:preprotein translocase subunit SecB